MRETFRLLASVMGREVRAMLNRPLYMFCMVVAPLCCYAFFTTLMNEGLPEDIPAAVVDQDNTTVTRQIVRNLDSFQQVRITASCSDVAQARRMMQRGEIYAFYHIPKGTTSATMRSEQPVITFYTDAAYLIPASLLYRDMKMMSEYASAAVARETLYKKGYTEDRVMGILQPIKMEMHAVGNPWLNYSVYLCNTLLPGILALQVMLLAIYSIYEEQKKGTQLGWLDAAGGRIGVAVVGKLLPQTLGFMIMAVLYNVYLYGFLHFPLHCGPWPMLGASLLLILASQSVALFLSGCVPSMRWSLSLATLWSVLAFPISGFSFPVMAMPETLQGLSWLFPLRHYFLIYVDQALNGRPLIYSAVPVLCLMAFILLPLTVMGRLRKTLTEYEYRP